MSTAIDITDPRSYLALGPTRALAAELGMHVDWQPFLVPGWKAPSLPAPDDDRGVRHKRHRAHYLAEETELYARVQGLELRNLYRAADGTLAAAALLWARRFGPAAVDAYLDAAFAGYWSERVDITDVAALGGLLGAAGADAAGWADYAAGGEATAELAAVRADLTAAGVFNVPAYLMNDDVFVGRAHLPMIRWLASGSPGEPPL